VLREGLDRSKASTRVPHGDGDGIYVKSRAHLIGMVQMSLTRTRQLQWRAIMTMFRKAFPLVGRAERFDQSDPCKPSRPRALSDAFPGYRQTLGWTMRYATSRLSWSCLCSTALVLPYRCAALCP
jgi:hypothetical protein